MINYKEIDKIAFLKEIKKVLNLKNDPEYLINPATCEIIETKDFGKIRGILSFISTEPFQVKLK